MKTHDQHKEHSDAFNAASTRLGGKKQDQPDPVLLGVVNNAKPTLTGPGAGRRPRARAREHRRVDLRRQRRCVLEQERPLGCRQHHGRRGAARCDPLRGAGARGRRGAGAHHVAARRGRVAGRRRQRRVSRTRSSRPPMPVPLLKEQSSDRRHQDPMPIDERELARSPTTSKTRTTIAAVDARQLDEWRASDENVDTGIKHLVSTPASRRAFLFGGGALLGGVALAASGAGGLSSRGSHASERARCRRSRKRLRPEAHG